MMRRKNFFLIFLILLSSISVISKTREDIVLLGKK